MMGIKVHMAGQEDLEGPWNILLAGPGGSGKTLLASTAPDGLFVFFREEPTLKSIAARAPQFVKLLNEIDAEGSLTWAAHEKLRGIIAHLTMNPTDYKTLIIDSGDELFQAMKVARTMRQGGEFGAGDWNWLADMWREMLEALTALEMDVIFILHTKSQRLDDSGTFRELMLQGQAVDETSTWFDVVAALDTFEVPDESGLPVTKRALLTHSSRTYPWVVDRSGNMPPRWEISPDFVGDFDRLKALLTSSPEVKHHASEVGVIDLEADDDVKSGDPVPSPEELQAAKGTTLTVQEVLAHEEKASLVEQVLSNSEAIAVEAEKISAPPTVAEIPKEEVPIPSPPAEPLETARPIAEEQEEQPVTLEEAEANVKEVLDGEEVALCSVEGCTAEPLDAGMKEISELRYGKPLCREHFKAQS